MISFVKIRKWLSITQFIAAIFVFWLAYDTWKAPFLFSFMAPMIFLVGFALIVLGLLLTVRSPISPESFHRKFVYLSSFFLFLEICALFYPPAYIVLLGGFPLLVALGWGFFLRRAETKAIRELAGN